jgi:hypothetical protein
MLIVFKLIIKCKFIFNFFCFFLVKTFVIVSQGIFFSMNLPWITWFCWIFFSSLHTFFSFTFLTLFSSCLVDPYGKTSSASLVFSWPSSSMFLAFAFYCLCICFTFCLTTRTGRSLCHFQKKIFCLLAPIQC